MQYENRWEKIETIGEGGQGEVIRVLDKHKVSLDVRAIYSAIGVALKSSRQELDQSVEEQIRKGIVEIMRAENPMNHGALKILHPPNKAQNSKDAEKRLKRELEAMTQADHPNLLKIEDHNLDEKWFVSKYYPKGTLKDRSGWFTGQVERTLTAIRPVVEGVATLHKKGLVHRDIKPENIFVDEGDQLVLGDFGLVFFLDGDHTRISGTSENVGSTDWMPPWNTRMIEDISPRFDVFSLGKTIWSMVSCTPILRFWYHPREKFNLERMFPNNKSEMVLLNELLDKCIVEDEENCLENADLLLGEIDNLLRALRLGAGPVGEGIDRLCRVCGFGKYRLFGDKENTRTGDFGLSPRGGNAFKIFRCNNCGHVQLFLCQNGNTPAWE